LKGGFQSSFGFERIDACSFNSVGRLYVARPILKAIEQPAGEP
jgi:hypothetical protein